MTLLISRRPEAWATVLAVTAGTTTWRSTTLVAILLAAGPAIDLLAVRQLLHTIAALTRSLPAGRVDLTRAGPAPALSVQVTWGTSPGPRRCSPGT